MPDLSAQLNTFFLQFRHSQAPYWAHSLEQIRDEKGEEALLL